MSDSAQGFTSVSGCKTRTGEKIMVDFDGTRVIPASRRPDGSFRKEIRIRPGFVQEEERQLFVSKGTEFRQRLSELEKYPVGWTPPVEQIKPTKNKPKKNKNKKAAQSTTTNIVNTSIESTSKPTIGVSAERSKSDGKESEKAVMSLPKRVDTTIPSTPEEKKLRKLHKKLGDIIKIEQAAELNRGNLTWDQLNKLASKDSILQEIAELRISHSKRMSYYSALPDSIQQPVAPKLHLFKRYGWLFFATCVITLCATWLYKAIQINETGADIHGRRSQALSDEFEQFLVTYNKSYTPTEKERRFKIFLENKEKIDKHNQHNYMYTLGINQFADLSEEEFQRTYLGYRFYRTDEVQANRPPLSRFPSETMYFQPGQELPTQVDWRDSGCVGPVQNQGNCGSCWAFSSLGAVESAYCIKHGVLPKLSEQQLVDCAGGGNRGCLGGSIDRAFMYMIQDQHLCQENEYPYVGHQEQCRYRSCHSPVRVAKIVDIPHDNIEALKAAVAHYGPVAVGVQSIDWQFYHSGIYTLPCGRHLDHGVLLVGYGVTNGTDYWIIKNSWGSQWGKNGYIKLVMNVRKKYGECGILLDASYPVVD